MEEIENLCREMFSEYIGMDIRDIPINIIIANLKLEIERRWAPIEINFIPPTEEDLDRGEIKINYTINGYVDPNEFINW